ncbi:MAG: Glycogen synthase [Syntrophaceae bacterium PtaU1.Bin231]|mgnify:CR=1 FL=1|nr:MAG: Glycogen synthase [Syntrophaceae bacterium PtaB.Bin038]OPY86449.1 MAG: Glycogen synthase [Syntrophaceae bacterium PtaU1.Bin231]
MNVRIVYRHYRPLHDLYRSFLIEPPPQVSFAIPRTMRAARRLYPLYLLFGDWAPVRSVIAVAQDVLFGTTGAPDRADLLHFIQMVPLREPQRPYVVDFEHAAALANFVRFDESTRKRIENFFVHRNCRKIIPLTRAAEQSLLALLPDLPDDVRGKVEVIYPALPNHTKQGEDDAGPSSTALGNAGPKFLFVGNDVYRKGLHELMRAFRQLEAKYPKAELHVVSNAPTELKREYASARILHYDPIYSFDEMIDRFYLACDVLVLPTHCDTFGMAILNALSCGKPVVTTDQFAARELVRDGENGLIVRSRRLLLNEICAPDRAITRAFVTRDADPLLVEELIEALERLCADRAEIVRMSRDAIKDFEPGGRFSIGERNRKLANVYAGCADYRENPAR